MVEKKSKNIKNVEKGSTNENSQSKQNSKETKPEEKYNLNCNSCRKKSKFKIISISRRSGVKLECLRCGQTIHKNIKYLQKRKNGN